MRLAHLFVVSLFAVSMSAACGDDGGGGGGGNVDAPIVIDAPPDAPPELTGLGKRCTPSMGGADCPNTLGCLGPVGSTTNNGMCTTQCIMNATFMTDAQSVGGAITPNPSTQDAVCTAAYTGTIGTAACNSPFGLTPAHTMLMPNTTYTVQYACGITCGANNACPTGLTCNATIQQCRVM